MIRSLWIAKTGLDAQQTQLDVISNNLANVSTNGFKRARAVFEDLLYQTLRQPGASPRSRHRCPPACRSAPACARRHRAHLHPGQPAADRQFARRRHPGRGLLPDPAARRHHRLHARRRLPEGQPGPDRHLQRLSGAAGHHHPRQRQSSPSARTAWSRCCRAGSPTPVQVGSIQLATFVNPAACRAWGENLYLETAASGTATPNTPGTNGVGLLNQGYVETSNVNVVEELVNMIQTQRAYEINSRRSRPPTRCWRA
jgi:flagellar basal-body rod protein FlgG